MRVTLEGTERDIMEEESYITHSQLQEVVRDALAQQAVVYAESIRKQNETLTTLQAEVQTLQSAQTTPVAPPVQQNSMMLLSSLTDQLKPFVIPDFEGSYTSTLATMRMWEPHSLSLTDEMKLHAIMQQIPPEHYEQWRAQQQNCLDATTPEEPAWKLMLDQMRAFYSNKADKDLEGVLSVKGLNQGNRSVEQLWNLFQLRYKDVPTDHEARKKYDFLAALNVDLRKMIRATTTDITEKSVMDLYAQAQRLEDPIGSKNKTNGTASGSRNQQGNQQGNQQRQHQGSATTTNTSAGTQYPLNAADKALLAGRLDKFEGYAPATVKELHAKLDPSNVNSQKLNGFLRLNKLCYKCRDQGHQADACPRK